MSKIRISRPQSTPGAALYGSLRRHSTYVAISIHTGNSGDHHEALGDTGDDAGFKSAHDSRMMRSTPVYEERHGRKEYMGNVAEEAPELTRQDRGEEIIEVVMSHEQFAELITSTGCLVDCTIDRLRGGFGEKGRWYREEVKHPPDIQDRMRRRVEKAHEKALAEIDAQAAAVEAWTASAKVKDSARHALRMIRQHLTSNVPFAVTQAVEEMSVHVESAATIIADKVADLEAAGRLPKGSMRLFASGEELPALPMEKLP